ncbi:FGGY-family carbohydrate kinase [Halalkalibaculum sp. DA3122]|uniref:FGGY-family carbohydrate kinase n=1 Tax=Halalkalibaculum sp. DA3122 TaxID=3373607 RepID=UPI003755285E
MSDSYFIGCDVGTGSARIGIFNQMGKMVAMHSHPIKMWRPRADFVEQSSDDIWDACCRSIKEVLNKSDIRPKQVKGVGFDATCSLVALGEYDKPIPVSPDGPDHQNVMVWMDHRASKEADEINNTNQEVLRYVGGTISPEMETPKLLWLKRNNPDTWSKATRFFDLADYLVYRATGTDVRSVCTTTCKWTYLAHEDPVSEDNVGRWDNSYFREIGLEDLTDEEYDRIGRIVKPVGDSVGNGLTEESALQMGLRPTTSVGVSIIDAHAGGLGLLGMELEQDGHEGNKLKLEDRIALIGGTSSCHMAVSQEPKFLDGVWGPYYSAMIPKMWLNEGGQSATGALIDHIIFSSDKSETLKEISEEEDKTVYEVLNEKLYELAEERNFDDVGMLTRDLHVLPYFHGNRSPRADPSLLGSICGLRLSNTIEDLALKYLATIQAIAYGTCHIIETMNNNGYSIAKIMATGGGTKNDLFLKEHADICRCDIILPREREAVLLGGAVLGSVASGHYTSVTKAMVEMNHAGRKITPDNNGVQAYHDAKYEVFLKMYDDEISYFNIMDQKLQKA